VRASALIFLVAATLPGCNGPPGGAAPAVAETTDVTKHVAEPDGASGEPGPNQITIDNFAFRPARLEVAAGTKVTWINRDDVPHTATSAAKPRAFDSRTLDTDDQFAHVFTTPGTYVYFCAVHPHMTGTIIVK
jgi:plastocyanin